MTDFTIITDEQIDPESPVTSELMTALRDNGKLNNDLVAYDTQVFETSGTWTKPAGAADTDIIEIRIWGGGASGPSRLAQGTLAFGIDTGEAQGGAGGIVYGRVYRYSGTESVTIGAGATAPTVSGTTNQTANPLAGGDSQFGSGRGAVLAQGGPTNTISITTESTVFMNDGEGNRRINPVPTDDLNNWHNEWVGGADVDNNKDSLRAVKYGGAGSKSNDKVTNTNKIFPLENSSTISMFGGDAGLANIISNDSGAFTGDTAVGGNGQVPGGAGGGSTVWSNTSSFGTRTLTATGGDGGDGLCIVICYKKGGYA